MSSIHSSFNSKMGRFRNRLSNKEHKFIYLFYIIIIDPDHVDIFYCALTFYLKKVMLNSFSVCHSHSQSFTLIQKLKK